jgi:hypothetical protein
MLSSFEGRIAQLLGMPPELVGIPSGTDPMTYKNVQNWYDLHWKHGLEPSAFHVMDELSQWALPRGTWVRLNSDKYVAGAPLEQAQTAQILSQIVDPTTGQPAITVTEIREMFGLDDVTSPTGSGVLK